jgi:hypothetical protein
MAKNNEKTTIIQDQITIKKEILQDKKKAGKARVEAIEEQLKMKKQRVMQYRRKVSQDIGKNPLKEEQHQEYRLYSKLLREAEREVKALEQEIKFAKKDNDLEIKILENEIKELEAEKKLYASNISHMIKFSEQLDNNSEYYNSDEALQNAINEILIFGVD